MHNENLIQKVHVKVLGPEINELSQFLQFKTPEPRALHDLSEKRMRELRKAHQKELAALQQQMQEVGAAINKKYSTQS